MIALIVFAMMMLYMCAVWLWYRLTNNPSVVDVAWAIGLMISGFTYLTQQQLSFRTIVLSLALMLWGIRLGGYLWWTRVRIKQVDKRYHTLSDTWKIKKSLGFFINFQLQGVFIFIVSLSWYFIALNPKSYFNHVELLALVLFVIALGLESLADIQLTQFKKMFPGKVCDQKLWRLSRHPNCFFEWLVWCAFSLFALSSPYGVWGLISPLALYLIMIFLTLPITENESIKSRGQDYLNYQQMTPKFFPKIKHL